MEKINIEEAVENYKKFIVDFNNFIQSDEFKRFTEIGEKYRNNPDDITEEEKQELVNIKFPELVNTSNSVWLMFLHLLTAISDFNNNGYGNEEIDIKGRI